MAGVDYEQILRAAEKEADVIVWDGGNNDWPFYVSDLEIVALDPHRPGHERAYYPGEVNFLRADVLVINKVNTARAERRRRPRRGGCDLQPRRQARPDRERDHRRRPRRACGQARAGGRGRPDGDPRRHAVRRRSARRSGRRSRRTRRRRGPTPSARCADTFAAYPHMDAVLPAMGYSAEQLADLAATINATPCDVVAIGTPDRSGQADRDPAPVGACHVSGGRHFGSHARLRHRRVLREARARRLRQGGRAPGQSHTSSGPQPPATVLLVLFGPFLQCEVHLFESASCIRVQPTCEQGNQQSREDLALGETHTSRSQ